MLNPHTAGTLKLTHMGHATWLVEIDGRRILTDPHASSRALLPKRYKRAGLALGGWPAPDAVVVSHGHWDHCDVPSLRQVSRTAVLCYPPDLADVCGRIRCHRSAPLAWWESAEHDGIEITAVPARHFGRRWFRERPRGYCGFVIRVGETRVYFAGDTAYFSGFAEIGARMPRIRVALIPVGAYEPAWYMRRVHCNPEDAVRAFADLGADILAPMHWGTFPLTTEAPDEPVAWTQDLMAARGWLDRLCIVPHGYAARIPAGEPGPGGVACVKESLFT